MTELDYHYNRVTCGHFPSVVVMDRHKKGAFGMPEYAKLHVSRDSSEDDVPLTEERLADELLNLRVEEIRALCMGCGIDHKSSKMDLIIRLKERMSPIESPYNKVLEKVWGASGGWAVITCPCGVVYSVKLNIRAESPRDYADLLLSWKHVPNVTVYDYPRGLASHANHRSKKLFNPFEGRLLQPSEENIKKASENHRKEPADQDGHPVTGSCDHYVLSDVFHQNNSKDLRDSLRKIGLVPELAGKINIRF
ncbi:unnamed protein product [Leuciscus chuanchicus]